jgi:glucokinase
VQNGRCQATNLPWVVDGHHLAARIELNHVILMNDLEANAYGIATLEPSSFAVIQQGSIDVTGNAAVISAGTGLGEAGLYWDGRQQLPFATEGGHSSFSPCTELQDELLGYLRRQFHHVSWERVLSGPGLLNIYKFLRDTGRGAEPPWLAEEMKQKDPSAVISRAGLEGRSELCANALEMFVSLYGSEASNLSLKMIATGGVYLGGGIAPKILPKLNSPAFRDAFLGKGRMKELLATIPIRVILNDKTALRGAARRALLDSAVPSVT